MLSFACHDLNINHSPELQITAKKLEDRQGPDNRHVYQIRLNNRLVPSRKFQKGSPPPPEDLYYQGNQTVIFEKIAENVVKIIQKTIETAEKIFYCQFNVEVNLLGTPSLQIHTKPERVNYYIFLPSPSILGNLERIGLHTYS